jgi:putative FmdB family regulatory protein
MPTYEYNCKNCGENFEVFQSFSEKPLKKHKDCGGQLQKVFHVRGIVFKGSGFYATDGKAAAKSKDESKSKDEGTSKSKDEGKGAPKEKKKDSKPVSEKATAATTD